MTPGESSADSVELRGVDGDSAKTLAVRAQPGARRVGVAGTWNGHLKLAVSAPADQGRANEAILALVAAKLFGLRPSAVELVRGHSSRQKQVRLLLPPDVGRRRLAALLSSD